VHSHDLFQASLWKNAIIKKNVFSSNQKNWGFVFFGVLPPFPKLHLLVDTLGILSNVACNSASFYFFQDKEKVELN
jgi:hypothetical protein